MVKKYSREFREDAMKLASEIGVRKTSEKLDVSPKTLYAWQRKERLSRGIAIKGLRPGESPEDGMGKHGTSGGEFDPQKSAGFYGGPVTEVKPRHLYAWIDRNRGTSSIALCCLALSVRREGFYAWQKRKNHPSSDDKTVSALKAARKAHPDYGVSSLRNELPDSIRPSYGKCFRLCRENGLLHRKKTPHGMTKRNDKDLLSEDLIQRDFKASAPNTKWLSDITEMKCKNGELYLAAILDCFDGAIVGLSMGKHKRAELCVSALENAVGRFGKRDGLILHSDHGSQYTSRAYRNARMESFFATLKKDLIYRLPLYKLTRDDVRRKIFSWIELYYNSERRYTANAGSLPPLEKRAASAIVAA